MVHAQHNTLAVVLLLHAWQSQRIIKCLQREVACCASALSIPSRNSKSSVSPALPVSTAAEIVSVWP